VDRLLDARDHSASENPIGIETYEADLQARRWFDHSASENPIGIETGMGVSTS